MWNGPTTNPRGVCNNCRVQEEHMRARPQTGSKGSKRSLRTDKNANEQSYNANCVAHDKEKRRVPGKMQVKKPDAKTSRNMANAIKSGRKANAKTMELCTGGFEYDGKTCAPVLRRAQWAQNAPNAWNRVPMKNHTMRTVCHIMREPACNG